MIMFYVRRIKNILLLSLLHSECWTKKKCQFILSFVSTQNHKIRKNMCQMHKLAIICIPLPLNGFHVHRFHSFHCYPLYNLDDLLPQLQLSWWKWIIFSSLHFFHCAYSIVHGVTGTALNAICKFHNRILKCEVYTCSVGTPNSPQSVVKM